MTKQLFRVMLSSYYINDVENAGVKGYHLTPLCEAKNLALAIKQAYAHVASINEKLAEPGTEEAHGLQILKGDQVFLMARINSLTDLDGFRYFSAESISWELPMCEIDVAAATEEIASLERWNRTLSDHHTDKATHEVTIAYLKAQVNCANSPIPRTRLQATLYRVESELDRKPSAARHFILELGI
jgi:hypothetical protein